MAHTKRPSKSPPPPATEEPAHAPAKGTPQRTLYELAREGGLTVEHRMWYATELAALEKAGLIEVNPRKKTHYRATNGTPRKPMPPTRSLRIPDDLIARVDALAERSDQSRTDVILAAVEAFLSADATSAPSDRSGTRLAAGARSDTSGTRVRRAR